MLLPISCLYMKIPKLEQYRRKCNHNPVSLKCSEATINRNVEDTRKNKETLNIDHTIPNVPKLISGRKGDQSATMVHVKKQFQRELFDQLVRRWRKTNILQRLAVKM
jgi:hypothetical protein